MAVAVMNIGEMGMRMRDRQMDMRVRMRFVAGIRKVVFVLMMFIMTMPVRVFELLMTMPMLVSFPHVQPDSERHQKSGG
jgi:hypothetical protein